MVRGEGEFKGKGNITDVFLRPQVGKFDRTKLDEVYGTAVTDELIESLSEYTRLADQGKGEAFMHENVKSTATEHFKTALDEILPEGTEKYFSSQYGGTIEFELPFDMRQLLTDLEIQETVMKNNPSPANKARYDEIQNKLRQDPGHKFFTYETPDGNLAVVSDEFGNALHTAEGQMKVDSALRKLKRVRDGDMTIAAFEEEAARSTPGSIYPLIMDLAKQQDQLMQGYLRAIDNSEVGKKFNQLHRDIQKAEKRALKAVETIALLHPDNVVKNMSRERRAAFQDTFIDDRTPKKRKDDLKKKVGEYTSRPTVPFKNITVRDNPAVKFKKGGPVKSGIAEFIQYMQ
jgi:site-specific DNA-cytosine methylase